MASLKEIFIHVEQMEDWTFTLSSHDEKEATAYSQSDEDSFVPMA